jgi:hypothetical protein
VTRPTTRRAGIVATAVAAALALGGCGTTDALVGLHPAPAEESAAVPLSNDGATTIAARLLDSARAAAATKGAAGKRARAEVLSGDALTWADALAARGAVEEQTGDLEKEATPTVLAQSEGRGWPRAILSTTLDEATNTQYLHVMVSSAPDERFTITESVPMLGGAELPAVGADHTGAPFVDVSDGEGLVMAPDAAFKAYAAALAYPKPKANDAVSTDDPFAAGLKASATAQTKALKKLGTLTQRHTPRLKHAQAFRLADGGVVAFGMMERVDTFSKAAKAKELVLPSEYAKLAGTKKVTKRLKLTNLEPVVLVVPTEGEVRAIGAAELLVSASGS